MILLHDEDNEDDDDHDDDDDDDDDDITRLITLIIILSNNYRSLHVSFSNKNTCYDDKDPITVPHGTTCAAKKLAPRADQCGSGL